MMQHLASHPSMPRPRRSGKTEEIAFLLRDELVLARELHDHLRRAEKAFNRRQSRVAHLLVHLQQDLLAERRLLVQRLEVLSPGLGATIDGARGEQDFWALFQTDDADCRSHLEALVAGYARLLRFTSDTASALRILGEPEGTRILERLRTVGSRGLWYLEIYLEGLALHIDESRLPQWLGNPRSV